MAYGFYSCRACVIKIAHEEERKMADSGPVFAGSIPANYNRYMVPMLFEAYARGIANRIDIPNEGRVLELACGTGAVTKQLRASLANTVHIVAPISIPECLTSLRRHLVPKPRLSSKLRTARTCPLKMHRLMPWFVSLV
jgi:hypothetical protein